MICLQLFDKCQTVFFFDLAFSFRFWHHCDWSPENNCRPRVVLLLLQLNLWDEDREQIGRERWFLWIIIKWTMRTNFATLLAATFSVKFAARLPRYQPWQPFNQCSFLK